MAISKVVTTVVDVGQGQCTFVCLYNDSSPPELAHTLLFDCGTDKSSPTTDSNITWIANTLKLMDTPTIDLLVFSHSDNDHISLMYDLLEAYGTKPKPLQVASIWYAGDPDFYTKNTFNILDYLSGYCKSFTTPDFSETQYDKTKSDWKKSLIWSSPDRSVQVGMLIGNVIDDEPGVLVEDEFDTVAEKKNRVSIVCALMHDERTMIICGDATNGTMAWVNDALGGNKFSDCLMVTLPHHGSRATGLSVSSNATANKKAVAVVKTFVRKSAAKTATISAYAKHHHPSIELINLFEPALTPAATIYDNRLDIAGKSHFLVCNVDVPLSMPDFTAIKAGYHTLTTKVNVLATYYYSEAASFSYQFRPTTVDQPAKFIAAKKKPPINPHACWSYTTRAGTGNTLAGYTSMPAIDTSRFTNVGSVPETATLAAGGKSVLISDLGEPVSASEFFPEWTLPSSPTPRRPPLASAPGGGAVPGRLRTFR